MKSSIKTILVSVFCCVIGYVVGTPQTVKSCECSSSTSVSSVLISTPDGEPSGNDSDGIVENAGLAGWENEGFPVSTGGTTGNATTDTSIAGTAGTTINISGTPGVGGTTLSTESLVKVEPLTSISDALEISSMILVCQ